MSEPLAKAIEKALKVEIPKEADLRKKDIVNRTVVEPDVPLCRGSLIPFRCDNDEKGGNVLFDRNASRFRMIAWTLGSRSTS
ncbi:hypothetical protein ABGB16_32825 [Micromonospora sp. B11E3]|uniref:hypothetical protein n=1 Tax=Micromonospora sp. B11E3 TaxID=3153562 RepID=UPI00325F6F75